MPTHQAQPKRDPGDVFPWKQRGALASLLPDKDSEWYGWINAMAPGPSALHVVGTFAVANPGVLPVLSQRVPQGINPTILQLELSFVQQPGVWPDIVVYKQARFDKVLCPSATEPTIVEVLCDTSPVATIKPVKLVQ